MGHAKTAPLVYKLIKANQELFEELFRKNKVTRKMAELVNELRGSDRSNIIDWLKLGNEEGLSKKLNFLIYGEGPDKKD